MSSRKERVIALKEATHDYVDKEKKRIENEVSVLEAVLSGRTGGAGVQQPSVEHVSAVAQNDVSTYLRGA